MWGEGPRLLWDLSVPAHPETETPVAGHSMPPCPQHCRVPPGTGTGFCWVPGRLDGARERCGTQSEAQTEEGESPRAGLKPQGNADQMSCGGGACVCVCVCMCVSVGGVSIEQLVRCLLCGGQYLAPRILLGLCHPTKAPIPTLLRALARPGESN